MRNRVSVGRCKRVAFSHFCSLILQPPFRGKLEIMQGLYMNHLFAKKIMELIPMYEGGSDVNR